MWRAKNRGFTLIELVVVIAILAVLLTITLVAINPARQFALSNNTKRKSDVLAILNAINQYQVETHGLLPSSITTTTQYISDTGANLCASLVPTYLASFPVDPLTNNGTPIPPPGCTGGYTTNYTVVKNASGRITVTAPAAQDGQVISSTR